jgi:hypothetical protein
MSDTHDPHGGLQVLDLTELSPDDSEELFIAEGFNEFHYIYQYPDKRIAMQKLAYNDMEVVGVAVFGTEGDAMRYGEHVVNATGGEAFSKRFDEIVAIAKSYGQPVTAVIYVNLKDLNRPIAIHFVN